jgi:hypothetical protein
VADNAELKNKKRAILQLFEESLSVLGTIHYTAQYEGWFGQLYTPARFESRGKVAKTVPY